MLSLNKLVEIQKRLFDDIEIRKKEIQVEVERLRREILARENTGQSRSEEDTFQILQNLQTHQGSEVIKLNIGGQIFQILKSNLLKYENSYFGVMFGEKWQPKQLRDETYYIDRNPTHFETILNYLRGYSVDLTGKTHKELKEIEEELRFYHLSEFAKIIRANLESKSLNPQIDQQQIQTIQPHSLQSIDSQKKNTFLNSNPSNETLSNHSNPLKEEISNEENHLTNQTNVEDNFQASNPTKKRIKNKKIQTSQNLEQKALMPYYELECAKNCLLSNSNRIATKISSRGWDCNIVIKPDLCKSPTPVKIKIGPKNIGNAMFGVIPKSFTDLSTSKLWVAAGGYFLYQLDGTLYSKYLNKPYANLAIKPADTIGIHFNEDGSIAFSVNGTKFPNVCDNNQHPIVAVVLLFEKDDSIELLQ